MFYYRYLIRNDQFITNVLSPKIPEYDIMFYFREGDEHFSEESMRMRNPLLYDQLIRKYQTKVYIDR